MGGVHPTVLSEQTLRDTKCDIVVRGEGELGMLDVVRGRRDRIINSGLIKDLDALPLPAWDMIDIYDYNKLGTNSFYGATKNNMEGDIQTSRGCPFNCAFCAQASMTQRKVRFKSAKRVLEEIEHLRSRYRCDRFYLYDDSFIIKKDRVEELCSEFEKIEGIDWHCLARVDRADLELFKKMKKANCRGICYGIESNSPVVLKNINKKTTPEMNERGINLAKEAGLRVRCQVIVGLPGETWESVKETEKLIRNTDADTWGVHIFVPLPGCAIWMDPKKYNFHFDNSDTSFEYYQTIGKQGDHTSAKLHKNPEQVIEWKNYLLSVVGKKDIAQYAERKIR